MAYAAEISRANRGCILFLIDQSGSMDEQLETGTKAVEVANTLNRVLQELITRCGREEGVRDYFDVGVIGYGDDGPRNALSGDLASTVLHPISRLEMSPKRIEDRVRKVSDGAGGIIEVQSKFPIWFDPVSSGGTPMCSALAFAANELITWCNFHPDSFPPVVIHLTDGASTDGDPEPFAEQIRQISTSDGQVILMNVHISGVSSREVAFPDTDEQLADQFARMLFRMSSSLVGAMLDSARSHGFQANERSRAFMFNVKTEKVVQFFDIGTRAANLR